MTDPKNDAVEAVARAIFLAMYGDKGGRWECFELRYQSEVWGAYAKAAMTAMPTPSEAATDSGEGETLARLIEDRLLGVDLDDQDLVLEDHDWRRIIATLRAASTKPDLTAAAQLHRKRLISDAEIGRIKTDIKALEVIGEAAA